MNVAKRYLTCISLFVCLLACYFYRSCMGVAILSMAYDSKDPYYKPPEFPINPDNKFDWDSKQQGNVLSAYFYGYFATNFLGSVLIHVAGPRLTMIIGLSGATFFNLLIPFVTYLKTYEYSLTILCRIMVGMFCGPLYPSIHDSLARWVPKHQRTTLTVITHSGNIAGLIVAYSTGSFIEYNDQAWRYYLYFGSALGFLSLVLWLFLVFDDPWLHPWISSEEKDMIVVSLYPDGLESPEPLSDVPFARIFSSWSVWTTSLAHMGNNFILYMFLTNFPKYLSKVYHQNARNASLYAIIPFTTNFLFQFVASLFAYLLQRYAPSLSITAVRKINGAIGFFMSVILLVPTGFTEDQHLGIAIFLLSASSGFLAFNQPGFFTGMIDLSPHYCHFTMGISNTLASIPGFVSPVMIAELTTKYKLINGWKYAFIATGLTTLLLGSIWLAFGTSANQNWHRRSEKLHHMAQDKQTEKTLKTKSEIQISV